MKFTNKCRSMNKTQPGYLGTDFLNDQAFDALDKVTEALRACHDSMLMSKTDMTHLRSFKKSIIALDLVDSLNNGVKDGR